MRRLVTDRPPRIFDRAAYRARRARAQRRHVPGNAPFLVENVAASLAARIGAVNRRFSAALDLGSRPEGFAALKDLAASWVRASPVAAPGIVVADDEVLPFADESFDLVVSILSLHAVNDLPGTLIQIRRTLKPDGLFLAALFGGDTLNELRQALTTGEAEALGGASPRIAPFADVRELGALLQRTGFALSVSDVERTMVHYAKLGTLFCDLRNLGETNVLTERRPFLPRSVLSAAAEAYAARFCDDKGRYRATFDIVYLTGWAPHESQQKPLKPGSATVRLADALGTVEHPTGEKPH